MSRLVAALILGLVLGFGAGPTAFAHGDATLELGAERIRPGGTVEIRADLGAGEAFGVTLISKGDGSRWFLGTLPARDEGHLQSFVTIPVDVPAGDYVVEVAFEVTVLRTSLTVAGSPIGQEGERPGQDDGLIQPVPIAPAGPGLLPEPGSSPETSAVLPAVPGARSPTDGIAIVAMAAGAAVGLVVLLRAMARRRGEPPPDGRSPAAP